ncbi:PWWP domain-containing protein 2B isoform X1 [Bos javanicus]|uniref:PWWP domain-containing protein 2B isoform X1 n=1 Tax=Bos javanicus TaxID=9906 RepID=UPI002AA73A26|nr:PWWP domain-containing protein 2B isoform X1 [Bos javanicus]XP_061259882.1 PWWP domain-containing protein 2B isoform X1 [Bos javanicus]
MPSQRAASGQAPSRGQQGSLLPGLSSPKQPCPAPETAGSRSRGSGLFGLPPLAPLTQAQDAPVNGCHGPSPAEGDAEAMPLGTGPPAPEGGDGPPEPPLPPVPPLPAGSLPPFPPYFEGAPFPPPLWLRNTYRQWVPQPPPRGVKRTRRRLSRNRDPGRLALSPIRLRPRQVLCEKCKSTQSPPEASPGPPAAPRPRREPRKPEDPDGGGDAAAAKKSRRERREEARPGVPRSPAIKISYSTPQGTGEVVEIPPRVHGSLEPFCPPPASPGGLDPEPPRDRPAAGAPASIPKLKLTRPLPPGATPPPPKIRLKPRRLGAGEQEPVYRAELVQELKGRGLPADGATHRGGLADSSSASSGEDDDCRGCPRGAHGPDNAGLAFLATCPGRSGCTSELAWSSDSLDESKSSGSDGTLPDTCDLSPGDGVPSSSKGTRPTVPPLTVRLHTQSVSKCVTEDGRTVAVGDIVWGKVHGFPWWPARVLDISLSQKEDGEPSWQEAKVSWFGSPTTSFLSTSKLSPFSEFFKLRFNRKKKGMYRKAITEAANAAQHVAPEIRELLTQFET